MSLEGQQLGEFEIIEHLGKGGMGAVYKARQTSLNRLVALKTLQASLAGNADYIARFRREARAAAVLNHPNLVRVHSAGESEGLYWFAMEYVQGESAKVRLKREGRLDPLEAMAIAIHVATALDYGWRKAALIHRDIKPDNIFLSAEGEVKLGDLGLAKSVGQEQGLTETGSAMGTPHYMSPEQARSMKHVDLRSDIYSLGCTLYHLLSGQPPYVGTRSVAVMLKHLSEPVPDLRSVWPECPSELAAAVVKMMQKQPEDRPQSYEEVIADLRRAYDVWSGARAPTENAAEPRPVAIQKPVGGKRKRALPVALVVAAVAASAAVVAWFSFAPWEKTGPIRQVERPETQRVAQDHEQSAAVAVADTPPAVASAKAVAVATTPQPAPIPVPTTPAPVPPPAAQATPAPSMPVPSPPATSTAARSATPKPATEVEKWFAQVDGAQQQVFQKQVLEPFEAGVTSLRVRYLASLDAAIARASAAGQVAETLSWRSERQVFEQAQNVAEDDAGTPAGVKALRAAFRLQLARLDAERTTQAKALLASYDAILAKNQTLLTQHQRFDDALLLKAKRDEIALAWLKPTSLVAVGEAYHPESGKPVSTSTLRAATQDKPYVNTLGMEFVPVPIVGGPSNEQLVLFSVCDTRVQDYEIFAKQTNCEWPKPDFSQGPTHPAVKVTWDDAQAFCAWLTDRERKAGKLSPNERYRLPTDHEWSCAVGIGDREDPAQTPAEKTGKITDTFPWGSTWPPPKGAGNYAGEELRTALAAGNYTWVNGVIADYHDAFENTSPVGSFAANRFGLYDMGGNVWQWCEDWFDPSQNRRVLRGGAWGSHDRNEMLSSYRAIFAPGDRSHTDTGFRCVLVGGNSGVSGPMDSAGAPGTPASAAATTSSVAMARKEMPFVNSLGMKFVPVEGTKVLFCIHATRKGDYASFADANPGGNDLWKRVGEIHGAAVLPGFLKPMQLGKGSPIDVPVSEGDDHPVVCVNVPDATAFCAWLSRKEGRVYRLPTDREWSYAVGIGPKESTTSATPESLSGKIPDVYPWGAIWPPPPSAGNYADETFKAQFPMEDYLSGYNDGYRTTAPVMSFKPNDLGIYDLGGNVWQWCSDWYNDEQKEGVLRGASWSHANNGAMLSSYRRRCPRDGRQINQGFRCVLEP